MAESISFGFRRGEARMLSGSLTGSHDGVTLSTATNYVQVSTGSVTAGTFPATAKGMLGFQDGTMVVTGVLAGDGSRITNIDVTNLDAAGSDTQVQFNDGGEFGGDSGFTFNKTTDTVTTKTGSVEDLSASVSLVVDGTSTLNGNVTVKNGQTFTSNTVDINGGAIDGTNIGAASRGTAAFTTLDANGDITLGSDFSDTITFNGYATTIRPSSAAQNLGADASKWNKLFVGTIEGSASGDTVNIGSKFYAAQAADFNGAVAITGALNAKGDVDLGDATGDTITATGRFDSALVPSTNGARDLGTSGLRWREMYAGDIDVSGTISGSVAVQGGAATLASATVAGTLAANGNVTVAGVLTANGNVDLGNATSDTITFTGRVDSDIVPSTDSTRNLGSATLRFANVYTGDLHLRNERGDWTLFEEADHIKVRNNLTGKMFRMALVADE